MMRTNEIRMDLCSGLEFTRKEVKIAAPEPEIRLPALIERGMKAIFSPGKFRTEDVKKDLFPTFSGLHRVLFCVIFLFANTVLQGGDPEKPVFRDESIFPCQEKHVHSSSIVECPSGDLLVCWFYGSGERTADDVLIQGARLRKGSGKWSEVFLMADTPGFPDCNPVLFIDPRERLWMFWITVLAQRWENSLLKYRITDDYEKAVAPRWQWQDVIILKPGESFAEALKKDFALIIKEEPMWAGYAIPYHERLLEASLDAGKREIGWMTRTHPLVLPSGRILLPLYSDGFNVSLVAYSDDVGEHWTASRPMVGLGPIQPSIVRKKDGTLLAYMRDSGDRPYRVLLSSSGDDGLTWTPALDTDIPNPGSSLEAISLKDGTWIMVYNDTEEGRHHLVVSLSEDEGKTWPWKRTIAGAGFEEKSFAYPSVIQTRDGNIHLTYSYRSGQDKTIKHAVFNKVWVKEAASE